MVKGAYTPSTHEARAEHWDDAVDGGREAAASGQVDAYSMAYDIPHCWPYCDAMLGAVSEAVGRGRGEGERGVGIGWPRR